MKRLPRDVAGVCGTSRNCAVTVGTFPLSTRASTLRLRLAHLGLVAVAEVTQCSRSRHCRGDPPLVGCARSSPTAAQWGVRLLHQYSSRSGGPGAWGLGRRAAQSVGTGSLASWRSGSGRHQRKTRERVSVHGVCVSREMRPRQQTSGAGAGGAGRWGDIGERPQGCGR